MPQMDVQDPPPEVSRRLVHRRVERLIGWLFAAFILSLFPLFIAGIMDYRPGQESFLHTISEQDLLTVAFTLSGAAAMDILISRRDSILQLAIGLITLLSTLLTISGYILLHAGQLLKVALVHFDETTTSATVLWLFVGTALLAFVCEVSSEA
jgi:hypothetical protein